MQGTSQVHDERVHDGSPDESSARPRGLRGLCVLCLVSCVSVPPSGDQGWRVREPTERHLKNASGFFDGIPPDTSRRVYLWVFNFSDLLYLECVLSRRVHLRFLRVLNNYKKK